MEEVRQFNGFATSKFSSAFSFAASDPDDGPSCQ